MKDQIELTAMELFLKEGYKKVTFVEIAQKLNITKGGIYHYFANKKELLFSVFDRILVNFTFLKLEIESKKSQGSTFHEILDIVLNEYITLNNRDDTLETSYEFLINFLREFPDQRYRLTDFYYEMQQTVREVIEADIKSGIFRKDLNIEVVFFEFNALLEGIYTIRTMYNPDNFNELARAALTRFHASLLNAPS